MFFFLQLLTHTFFSLHTKLN